MYQLRKFEYIKDDIILWNNFVKENNGSIFHLANFGRVYEETYGFKLHYYFVFYDEELIGLLPAYSNKNIFANYFKLVGEKLLFKEKLNINNIIELVEKIASQNCLKRIYFFDNRKLPIKYYKNNDNVNVKIDLKGDEKILFEQIGPKKRNMIRKAEESNLTLHIIQNIGHNAIHDFYKIYSQNYRDLGTPVQPIHFFKNQIKYLKDYCNLLFVEYDNKIIATMWLHNFNGTMSDPEAASIKDFLFTRVNDYIYWNAFQLAIQNNCHTFNLGRSQKNSGSFRFKSNYKNAKLIELFEYSNNRLNSISSKKKKMNFFIKAWQNNPLVVTNFIGPLIRKNFYLG